MKLAATLLLFAAGAWAGVPEDLKRARENYEYGDFKSSAEMAARAADNSAATEKEQIEAYRLLALASHNLGRREHARDAFVRLLFLEPDYKLDPFFVPPPIVAFFEEVKTEKEPALAQIRERKRLIREQERLRQEDRKRLLAEEEKRRGEREGQQKQAAAVVLRTVEQRQKWITFLPFGAGQFQNGNANAGTMLAIFQGTLAIGSAASFGLIEALRDDGTGRFSSNNLPIAERINVVKWSTAILFYALWGYGIWDALSAFQPEVVTEAVQPAPAQPAPAPAAPAPEPPPPPADASSEVSGDK